MSKQNIFWKGFIGDPAFEQAAYLCKPIPELLQENPAKTFSELKTGTEMCSNYVDTVDAITANFSLTYNKVRIILRIKAYLLGVYFLCFMMYW
jgi:hypothetical protein